METDYGVERNSAVDGTSPSAPKSIYKDNSQRHQSASVRARAQISSSIRPSPSADIQQHSSEPERLARGADIADIHETSQQKTPPCPTNHSLTISHITPTEPGCMAPSRDLWTRTTTNSVLPSCRQTPNEFGTVKNA